MSPPPIGPLLTMTGMTRQYPGCLANDRVSLTVERGQIHALLGENGAGKSTLVKMIYGVVKPDAGEIFWDGRKVSIPNAGAAQRLGIGMVFQHFSLFEALTVTENVALGLAAARQRVDLRERILQVSAEYGLKLDPDSVVHDLSAGERQQIEIVRCLLRRPKLLIMDEPTSGTDSGRGAEAVRHPAPLGVGRLLDPVYQPQAGGSARAVFHGDDPSARAERCILQSSP